MEKTTNERKTMNCPKRNDAPLSLTKQDLMRILTEDDAIKTLLQSLLQEVLEAEMDEALRAGKSERTAGRLGYRSGHYGRTLVTRVGKLEPALGDVARDRATGLQLTHQETIEVAQDLRSRIAGPRFCKRLKAEREGTAKWTRRLFGQGIATCRSVFRSALA